MSNYSVKKLKDKKGPKHVFRIHKLDGTTEDKKEKFDYTNSIFELKSFILYLTDNEPFLLDFFMHNTLAA